MTLSGTATCRETPEDVKGGKVIRHSNKEA